MSFKPRAVRSKIGKRKDLDNRFYRSAWEANYARYLKWLKENQQIKDWFYEDREWEFPVKRGNRFYKSDFRVIENNGDEIFYEVKGWMDRDSKTKLNRMSKYYPDVRIIVVDGKQYSALSKQMKPLIEEWE